MKKRKKLPNNKRKEFQLTINFMEQEKPRDFTVYPREDNDDFDILMAADLFKEEGCVNQNFSQFKNQLIC